MNKTSKRILGVGLPLTMVAATGLAFAAWTTSGTGTGTATATTGAGVSAALATVDSLYPGKSSVVNITLTNTNPYPVSVTDIPLAVAGITSNKGAACDAATGVSYTKPAAAVSVPAAADGTHPGTATVAGSVLMSNASDTTCQGATFTIPLTTTAVSAAS